MCLGYRTMKSRDLAIRLKRREVEEKSRKVDDLERIIREFDQMAADLERQIQLEEDRTGIRDRGHFSYSTFAKAAAQRRDNLRQSTEGLREKLTAAVRERDDTVEQFSRASQQSQNMDDPRPGRRDRPLGFTALR
ncbi:Flagellar export protein FliJ [Hyphomicrobium sp. MC1]|nr:Flagellar export protein FliJ [Hyphomicrobium sp. MC1]